MTASPPPWQKILWSQQPYADNYTPPAYLSHLDAKPNVDLPDAATLMRWSMPLTQQLCLTLSFVSLFLHLRDNHISAERLAMASTAAIMACGLIDYTGAAKRKQRLADRTERRRQAGEILERRRALAQPLSYALLGLVVLALSPLLKTLTEATTSDSITALATALFLLSFALADFSSSDSGTGKESLNSAQGARRSSTASSISESSTPSQETQLPATLSLNAALCASIVLASRLQTPIDVFSLVLASICMFAFVPRYIRRHLVGTPAMPCFTLALVIVTAVLLAYFSLVASTASLITSAFLNVACPLWMRRAQSWKQSRRGPWDMGVPRLRSQR